MLQSLQIKNIAIISDLTIKFNKGLTVLSGETGAGKTIILSAINFLVGQRADKSLIKSGQDYAKVVGIFDISSDVRTNIEPILDSLNLSNVDNQIIISREMYLGESSMAKINGEFVTVYMLKQLTQALIDIHGQNEHQYILDSQKQLSIIDNYSQKLSQLKDDFKIDYKKLLEIDERISRIGSSDSNELDSKIEFLEHEYNELKNLKLTPEHESQLEETIKKVSNSKSLNESIDNALNILEQDDNSNVSDKLSTVSKILLKSTNYDKDLESQYERIDSLKLELSDIIEQFKIIKDNLEFDSVEFGHINKEFNKINRLKLKHSTDILGLKAKFNKIEIEIEELIAAKQSLKTYRNDRSNILKNLYDRSVALSNARREIAQGLSEMVVSELSSLGMKDTNFNIWFQNEIPTLENFEQQLNSNGIDKLEFLFSANKGQEPKKLNKVISGGEMSRLMLALKVLLGKSFNIPTMIFDEIDTGVSGNIAKAISIKMKTISKYHQVILISHQPQIVAMADNNLRVYKYQKADTTFTDIQVLDKNNKEKHLAAMISGDDYTQSTLKSAQDMILKLKKYN